MARWSIGRGAYLPGRARGDELVPYLLFLMDDAPTCDAPESCETIEAARELAATYAAGSPDWIGTSSLTNGYGRAEREALTLPAERDSRIQLPASAIYVRYFDTWHELAQLVARVRAEDVGYVVDGRSFDGPEDYAQWADDWQDR